ncbi:MAG: hypothetical protein SF123_26515, partial [Chloroflexota bacterium]|nr:hypothetical protein [Chloroflexota bacterium]
VPPTPTNTPVPPTPTPIPGTPVPPPQLTCPAGYAPVTTFSGEMYVDDVFWETQDGYSFNLPQTSNINLQVASMVGHPDDGCPGSGAGTCNQGQLHEEFNILIEGSNVAFVPDHGEDRWQVFSFDVGMFMAGMNDILFAHTRNPSSPNSVSYITLLCAQAVPPTATPVPPTNTPVPPTNTPVPPTNTPVPPTNTPVPPTNTPVPPTNTPVPPTNTPEPPTNTPEPPTNTPEPPTATPNPS